MEPTQLPIPGVLGIFSREVKRPGLEAGHSHLVSSLRMSESRGIDSRRTSPYASMACAKTGLHQLPS